MHTHSLQQQNGNEMTNQPPEEPMCCTKCLEPAAREYKLETFITDKPWRWTGAYTHEDGTPLCSGATAILESDLSLIELEPGGQDPDEWLDYYRDLHSS